MTATRTEWSPVLFYGSVLEPLAEIGRERMNGYKEAAVRHSLVLKRVSSHLVVAIPDSWQVLELGEDLARPAVVLWQSAWDARIGNFLRRTRSGRKLIEWHTGRATEKEG